MLIFKAKWKVPDYEKHKMHICFGCSPWLMSSARSEDPKKEVQIAHKLPKLKDIKINVHTLIKNTSIASCLLHCGGKWNTVSQSVTSRFL